MRKNTIFPALVLLCLFTLLSSISHADLAIAVDPLRLGVGARPLSMGKAYCGYAEGIESMFLNPSGLAGLKSWEMTSMYGKFVNQVAYFTVGYAIPSKLGTLGIGIVNAGLSIASPVAIVETYDGEIIIIPSTTEATRYDYNNGVLLLTYAKELNESLAFGGNFKVFKTTLTGYGATSSDNAQGVNLDMGIKYHPKDKPFTIGANLQNLVPAGLGGALTYGDGYTESIGQVLKLGGAVKVLGDQAWIASDSSLIVNLDYDLALKVPSLMRLGSELWIVPEFALRAGLDQDLVGAGTMQSNITAGVGIKVQGIRFDFAYHEYNNVPDNTTYYFSITTVPMPPKPKEKKEAFQWDEPLDKTITLLSQVPAKGHVIDFENVATLKLNDQGIAYYSDGAFNVDVPMTKIRNKIKVAAQDGKGQVLKEETRRVIKLKSFPDVPENYWAKPQIDLCYTADIAVGYPDGFYKPDQVITKAELASFLMKARDDESQFAPRAFKDVAPKYWGYKWINLAKKMGFIKGTNGYYDPERPLTRADAVNLMVKILDIPVPVSVTEGPYLDVPGRHTMAKAITAVKGEGMLEIFKGDFFEMNKGLLRSEAIDMISRSRKAKTKVENLWNY